MLLSSSAPNIEEPVSAASAELTNNHEQLGSPFTAERGFSGTRNFLIRPGASIRRLGRRAKREHRDGSRKAIGYGDSLRHCQFGRYA